MRRLSIEIRLRQMIEVERLTQRKAAELLGCSESCVERTCKRLGLKTQRSGPRSGALHPDWKGGRILVGGYWYRWTDQHPYRTKRNYIAEHRLVAEAMIGRYLLPGEVVHHRNGNPQDNRAENLEVFSSNAEHLKAELTGHVPRWSPEGWAAMQAAIRKPRKRRKPAVTDALEPPQSIDRQ